jgi:hypothetical protein
MRQEVGWEIYADLSGTKPFGLMPLYRSSADGRGGEMNSPLLFQTVS